MVSSCAVTLALAAGVVVASSANVLDEHRCSSEECRDASMDGMLQARTGAKARWWMWNQEDKPSPCPGCPCKWPASTSPVKWRALRDMVEVLNELNAPYNIHGGTLLGLVRSCSIFDGDVDVAVERDWLAENYNVTKEKLIEKGFSPGTVFGKLGTTGYEHAWSISMLGARESLSAEASERDGGGNDESREEAAGSLNGTFEEHSALLSQEGIRVDLFTIQRTTDRYIWGLWDKGKLHNCIAKSTGTAFYQWLDLNVSIPVPVESVLVSMYGTKYMEPVDWRWNVEPFTIGSCV